MNKHTIETSYINIMFPQEGIILNSIKCVYINTKYFEFCFDGIQPNKPRICIQSEHITRTITPYTKVVYLVVNNAWCGDKNYH